MKLTRAELRKILYDFNSISNRLLQSDYNDYSGVLAKFVSFLENNEIIYEYIGDCGKSNLDLINEFHEVQVSYGRCIFSIGMTNEEEVRDIFAILSYCVENNIQVPSEVALGYSTSSKYQDKIKGFNDRVVMVLIRHIESFLTKIGIDMGIDEKVTYSINIQNGQVNIANDNANITAANKIGFDQIQLSELIQAVRNTADNLTDDEIETLNSVLEVVEVEAISSNPRRGFLKTAITSLRMLKGTTELAAAIATLIQFIQPLL